MSYTVFLFGYFYLIIRLIVECFIQFGYLGKRAFFMPLPTQAPDGIMNFVMELFQESPFMIFLTNIVAAVMAVIAIISICMTLGSKATSIYGLKNSALYFFLFVLILPFRHSLLMSLMEGFLVLFYSYLCFSSYIKEKIPKNNSRKSTIGLVSFIILISYVLTFIFICTKELHRFRNSIPLEPSSVTISDKQYTDGMIRFQKPREWSLDTMFYNNGTYPVSYFTDAGTDNICVYSSIIKDDVINGHNIHVATMYPHNYITRDSMLSIEKVKVNKKEVVLSRYLHRDSLYVNVITIFDKRSRKATSFLTTSVDSTRYKLIQMTPILETTSFNLDGNLLEYQSVQ